MLAAQMQKSADKAAAAVSVIVTAPRPVGVVGKMLQDAGYYVRKLCRTLARLLATDGEQTKVIYALPRNGSLAEFAF
jgi:hypothetical protein